MSGSRSIPAAELERLYHRDYYLADCDGHREFHRSHGHRLSRRLARCLKVIGNTATRVVDVGCGRGELARHLARDGATVVALDPSSSALQLVRSSQDAWSESRGDLHLLRARGESLPLADGWAELVVLSDVVEHLPPDALDRLVTEGHRVLAPGGRLFVHTQPNRWLVDYTVPFFSRISRLWGVTLPRDLRSEAGEGSGPEYHVAEQSPRSLERTLRRAGFRDVDLWLEGSYPVHRIFGDGSLKEWVLARFRRSRRMKRWLASQIFAVAQR